MCLWQTLWTSKRQLDDKIPIWNTHTRLVCASLMIQIHGNFNLNSHQPSVHWWWGASQPHRGRVCGLRRIFTTNQHMLHTYIFYLTTFCTHQKLQSNTFSNLVCFSFERNFVCSLTIFISVPCQILGSLQGQYKCSGQYFRAVPINNCKYDGTPNGQICEFVYILHLLDIGDFFCICMYGKIFF